MPYNYKLRESCSKIIELYENKMSIQKIGKHFGVSGQTIKSILIENGIEIKKGMHKYYVRRTNNIDTSCFDIITEESAYWIGMLITDGNIGDNGRVELSLKESDSSHIYKFKEFLKTDFIPKIKTRNGGFSNNSRSCLIYVYSKDLVDCLQKYNVIPRKTFITCAPDSLKYNRHFWRGCIDGDGSLTKTKKGRHSVVLYGTETLCEQFLSFVKEQFPLEQLKCNIHKTSSIYGIKFSKKRIVIKLLEILYGDSLVYLERKKILSELFIKELL